MQHVDEITAALSEVGFLEGLNVKDAATSNQAWRNQTVTLSASEFIPKEVLAKFDLSGSTKIGYKLQQCNGVDDGVPPRYGFVTDDPPHVFKRVAKAMEDRSLLYGPGTEMRPMTMTALADVVDAVTDSRRAFALSFGGLTRLKAKRDNFERQSVPGTAKIISATSAAKTRNNLYSHNFVHKRNQN